MAAWGPRVEKVKAGGVRWSRVGPSRHAAGGEIKANHAVAFAVRVDGINFLKSRPWCERRSSRLRAEQSHVSNEAVEHFGCLTHEHRLDERGALVIRQEPWREIDRLAVGAARVLGVVVRIPDGSTVAPMPPRVTIAAW